VPIAPADPRPLDINRASLDELSGKELYLRP
jgi:hypothetical protein